jgi:hypothetical protein
MDFGIISRDNSESIRIAFKNVDGGGSITTGYGVALVTTAASFDGVSAVKRTGALQGSFFGISTSDVAINGFGKAVVWGYAASVAISNVGTSITVTAGNVLIPGAVSGTQFSGVASEALSAQLYKYVIAGSTNTISGAAWVSGFVRGF